MEIMDDEGSGVNKEPSRLDILPHLTVVLSYPTWKHLLLGNRICSNQNFNHRANGSILGELLFGY